MKRHRWGGASFAVLIIGQQMSYTIDSKKERGGLKIISKVEDVL